MTTYYRFTEQASPMSDWGHAMFAENRDKVEGYGSNEYTLCSTNTVSIYDLEEIIKSTWIECQENENFGVLNGDFSDVSADTVFEAFCPTNIVDSAQGYDHDFVCWLWDMILEPKNIMAVRTQDGAVCFDEELIKKVA